ncbi:S53 family peptidase [Lichenicola sp.]|uniref:S53 family peptidase n=1 Tax=Lichenicola sp. TaxID=2804529 RepID=UPI003B000913
MTETHHPASTHHAAATHARRPGFRTLGGSARQLPANSRHVGAVPDDHFIETSIYVRRRDETALVASLDQAGSDPAARRVKLGAGRATLYANDLRELSDYASLHGLTVIQVDPARRLIRVGGNAAAIDAAFGTAMGMYDAGSGQFRGHVGDIQLPDHLHGLVESVLGLDSRAIAHTRIVRPHKAQPAGLEPNKIGPLYQFPTGVDGTGVTIALIELGGGFTAADNTAAFGAMGLAVPSITAVSVDGGTNMTGTDADGEVALDIQVSGGLAPGARIAVYFTPNTDAGFSDAISQAVHDTTNTPSVISISWGGPENSWTSTSVTTMNGVLQDAATLGISVYVASGDSFATDGVDDGKAHVDFPASSPFAIGCGGTHITVSGTKISHEVVWNDGAAGGGGTGGGISDLFDIPAFQSGVTLPPSVNAGRKGRGVPDVAGDAAPGSGYIVVVGGQKEVVGGTSGVAPLWAGLTALINQKASVPVGFLPDYLYPQVEAGQALTVEITTGDNKPEGSALGYAAGPTWNACTGLGRPNGQALFTALTARTASGGPTAS